jgi:hypothetical protein
VEVHDTQCSDLVLRASAARRGRAAREAAAGGLGTASPLEPRRFRGPYKSGVVKLTEIAAETGLNWRTVRTYLTSDALAAPAQRMANGHVRKATVDRFAPLIDAIPSVQQPLRRTRRPRRTNRHRPVRAANRPAGSRSDPAVHHVSGIAGCSGSAMTRPSSSTRRIHLAVDGGLGGQPVNQDPCLSMYRAASRVARYPAPQAVIGALGQRHRALMGV